MSLPATQDFSVIRGDTFQKTFNLVNIDLTGYTVNMQVRSDSTAAKYYTSISDTDGIDVVANTTVLDSNSNSTWGASVTINISDWSKYPLGDGTYPYDIQFTSTKIATWISGNFEVTGDITR